MAKTRLVKASDEDDALLDDYICRLMQIIMEEFDPDRGDAGQFKSTLATALVHVAGELVSVGMDPGDAKAFFVEHLQQYLGKAANRAR
jgi:hypothetical protein